MRLNYLALLFLLLLPGSLLSESDFGMEPLTVREALLQAIASNYGIRVDQLSPSIARQREVIEESFFDPTVTANFGYRETLAAQAASVLDGAAQPENRNLDAGVSLGKAFSPGTEVTVGSNFLRRRTNSVNALLNPDYSSEAGIQVRQPLLRNAGMNVNLAPLRRAKKGIEESEIQFENSLASLFGDVVVAYWEVSAAAQRLALRDSSIHLSETILEKTKEERDLGLATRTDILQAQAELAERLENRLQAERVLADAVDRLRFVLGESLQQETDQVLLTDDLPEPTKPQEDFPSYLSRAVEFDPASRARQKLIEQQEYDLVVARNSARPNLDVVVGGDYLGREDNLSDSYQQLIDRSGYHWRAGVELRFPWGLREGQSRRRQTLLQIRQSEILLEESRAGLRQNLRSAWRRLNTGLTRMESARATLQLRKEVLESEEARRERGLAQLSDVLDAARLFDEALLREVDAKLETLIAYTRLLQLDGTIFGQYGFTLDEIAMTSR